MVLLVFAHKNEAEAFIDQFHANKLTQYPFPVYQWEKGYILISGEGGASTLFATSQLIGHLERQISSIYNIGVCGVLPFNNLKNTQTVISVRTVYAEKNNFTAQFNSFTSADENSSIDIISASDRVLDNNYAEQLSPYAPLVDREAWYVAFAAEKNKIPFYAYKLVSDCAGSNTQCFDVTAQSILYSEKLFHFFCQQKQQLNIKANDLIQTPEGFYFSTSQKQKLKKILKNLSNKYSQAEQHFLKQPVVDHINAQPLHPKVKASLLIEQLNKKLTPFQSELKAKLDDLITQHQTEDLQVSASANYEDENIAFTIKAKNKKQLESSVKKMNEFPFDKFKNILRGET